MRFLSQTLSVIIYIFCNYLFESNCRCTCTTSRVHCNKQLLLHADWLPVSATRLSSVDECRDFNIDSPVTEQQVLPLLLKHLKSCSGGLLIMMATIENCAPLYKLFGVNVNDFLKFRFQTVKVLCSFQKTILGDFLFTFFFYAFTFKQCPIQNPTFLTGSRMNRIIGTLRHIWIRRSPNSKSFIFLLNFPVISFNLMSRKPRFLVFWRSQTILVCSPQDRWRDQTQTEQKHTICMK